MTEQLDPAQLGTIAAAQMGQNIALLHVLHCLSHVGVLDLKDVALSLAATEAALPPTTHEATRMVLKGLVKGIEMIQAQSPSPDPSQPTPPSRPNLQIIQGGRNT